MNKLSAMAWLAENVTKWPTNIGGIVSTPKGWSWSDVFNNGEVQLFTDTPSGDYVDCFITQQEWLDVELTVAVDYKTAFKYEKNRADLLQAELNELKNNKG